MQQCFHIVVGCNYIQWFQDRAWRATEVTRVPHCIIYMNDAMKISFSVVFIPQGRFTRPPLDTKKGGLPLLVIIQVWLISNPLYYLLDMLIRPKCNKTLLQSDHQLEQVL